MELKDLVGTRKLGMCPKTDVRHPFDPDANGVAFELDDMLVFVFEDSSDGYRSSAAPLLVAKAHAYEFGANVIEYCHEDVVCTHLTSRPAYEGADYSNECDILEIRSTVTGEIVLAVGTDNTDDYYPSFVCDWRPANLSVDRR